MQNNRKILGIALIAIGLVVVFVIVYFAFFAKSTPTTTTTTTTSQSNTTQLPSGPKVGTTTPGDQPVNHQVYDVSKEPAHQFNGNDLAKIAMPFSERFGSYSNQSGYSNFTDLQIMMTDSMQTWSDKYVVQLKSQSKSDGSYYGIETKALTTDVKSFDDNAGKASVVVTNARSESTAKINGGTPYLQKLDLNFLKVNGEWLVDKATWEPKS